MSKKTIVATFTLEVPDGLPIPDGAEVATYCAVLQRLQTSMHPENSLAWRLSDPAVFMTPPMLVANISGGVLQGVSSEIPVEIIALDYEADDDRCAIPPGDGRVAQASCSAELAILQPDWVREVAAAMQLP